MRWALVDIGKQPVVVRRVQPLKFITSWWVTSMLHIWQINAMRHTWHTKTQLTKTGPQNATQNQQRTAGIFYRSGQDSSSNALSPFAETAENKRHRCAGAGMSFLIWSRSQSAPFPEWPMPLSWLQYSVWCGSENIRKMVFRIVLCITKCMTMWR